MQLSTELPLNPEAFAKELAKTVKGQDEAIQYLAFLARIYDLKRRAAAFQFNQESQSNFPRIVLLLTGETGGGKTFLVKEFAKNLSLPYTKLDCSQVTGDGWVGTSVSDVVSKHLTKCKDGYGVLHLDEFDKILPSNGTDGAGSHQANFIAGKMSAFLELIDGDFTSTPTERASPVMAKQDSELVNNSLIICSGSFQQARDLADSSKSNPMGFMLAQSEALDTSDDLNWKEKMDELGYMKELAGRISHSIELKPYEKEHILDILQNGSKSPYQEYLNAFGKGQALTDEELDEIADKAQKSKSGLRILNSLLFEAYFNKGCWK